MQNYGVCPACKSTIPEDRLNDHPVVCAECGHTDNAKGQTVSRQISHKIIIAYLGLSIVALAALMHIFHWDKYALEIVPLKSFQMTQSASADQLLRIAEICSVRMHHDCTEEALEEASRNPSQRLASLEKLGELRVQLDKDLEALRTYSLYFSEGGQDLKAMYYYAVLLGANGQPEKSSQYFDQILAARPEVLQITVTRSYIKMLVSHDQLQEAKDLIEGIRQNGGNGGTFMEAELKEINEALQVASL